MTLNQGFDDTMIVAELQVNFSSSRNKCCFNLHYSGKDRFLCANGVKIYQLKAKSFEIKPYSLCVANISACFNPNQDELFPAAHR